MAPKKEMVIIPEKTSLEIEEQDLELEQESLDEQAKKEFTGAFLKKVKRIAYFLANIGLTLQEACLLSDVDFKSFNEEMETNPLIRKIIAIKELQYKKDLLSTVSRKARSGDDKLAMQLLEARYPNEYGPKKKNDGGADESGNVVIRAIEFIQTSGGKQLIKASSAEGVVVRTGNQHGLSEKVGNVMGAGMKNLMARFGMDSNLETDNLKKENGQ